MSSSSASKKDVIEKACQLCGDVGHRPKECPLLDALEEEEIDMPMTRKLKSESMGVKPRVKAAEKRKPAPVPMSSLLKDAQIVPVAEEESTDWSVVEIELSPEEKKMRGRRR